MRCRVGDLAVIVGAASKREAEDLGKFVQIVGRGSDWSYWDKETSHYWAVESASGPLWAETPHTFMGIRYPRWDRSMDIEIEDAKLRPIRPDEGTDEMIRIAGRPVETPRDVIRELTRSHK